jgi:hypothetical protein
MRRAGVFPGYDILVITWLCGPTVRCLWTRYFSCSKEKLAMAQVLKLERDAGPRLLPCPVKSILYSQL